MSETRPASSDESTAPAEPAASGPSARPATVSLLYRAIRKGYKDHGKDLAAAIAYYAFFSIFPFLLGVISAAGYFLKSEVAQARLYEMVARTIPGSAGLLRDNLEAVVDVRGTLGLFGVLGLLWSGSACFGAITRAINLTIGAKRTHPFFLSKLRYFLMAVFVSILLVLSLVMTTAVEVVASLDLEILQRIGVEPSGVMRLSGWAASFLFVFVVFALIYKVTPYVETRWRQVLPGALLAAAVFEIGKAAFVVYLDRTANFEAVYGSLSSIIVLLLWLYVSALVLIFGVEYNIVRWRARVASGRELGETP